MGAGDEPFQQSQPGQEIREAGLRPLAEAPGAVTGAGQDGEQSCWLFQSLHCTSPINQVGRHSKLMVGLNDFLAGIMPVPSSLASSHSFPGALNKSFFPALFVMWVNVGKQRTSSWLGKAAPSVRAAHRLLPNRKDEGELLQTSVGRELWSPFPSRIAKDLVASTGPLQLADMAGSPATNHTC